MTDPALGPYASALVDAVDAALPAWVERSVARLVVTVRGSLPADVGAAAHAAGVQARQEVGARLRRLLATDIDAQRTNPLSVLRDAARYPTEVARAAGVPPVARDPFRERHFPDDIYDLAPATWGDIDEAVVEPGLVWSAWKASEHLRRRRAEGRP